MGWWIALGIVAVLALILFSPVIIYLDFEHARLTADVRLLGIRIPAFSSDELFVEKKKKPSLGDKLVAGSKDKVKELAALIKEDSSLSLVTFLQEIFALLFRLVGRVLRGVVVDPLTLTVRVCTDDPMDTAMTYGEVCAVLYPLAAVLENTLRVRRKTWNVRPDFLGDRSEVALHLKAHLTLLRALIIVVWFLARYLTLLTEDTSAEAERQARSAK